MQRDRHRFLSFFFWLVARRVTLVPIPRWATLSLGLLALAASSGLGWAGAALHWFR